MDLLHSQIHARSDSNRLAEYEAARLRVRLLIQLSFQTRRALQYQMILALVGPCG